MLGEGHKFNSCAPTKQAVVADRARRAEVVGFTKHRQTREHVGCPIAATRDASTGCALMQRFTAGVLWVA
jgi:hypothetical protein